MWRIILADWRRFLWTLLGGWAMALALLLVIARAFGKECCLNDPERSVFVMKISVIALAYCQSAAVLWAQLAGNNIYHRQRLLATLPLSQLQLNLVHFLTGGLFLAAGAPLLVMTFRIWQSHGVAVDPWLALSTFLGVVVFLLLSMRNLFPRVLIPIAFVFILIPGTERLIRLPLQLMANPLASMLLAVATILFGWWVARQPTPRWAPGWGGRARPKHTLRRSGG